MSLAPTFHVEHRRLRHDRAPDEIARQVRTLVERDLARLEFSPCSAQFPDRIEKLAAALALWGSRINLTARPNDAPVIAFHVIDSLMPAVIAAGAQNGLLAGAFDPKQRVLDLGSGAGFPGLVLAAATAADFTLVEARRKRASFLTVVIAEMGLANAKVEMARARPADFAPNFDLVMARAFGAADDFYAIAAEALRAGGVAMLYASPSQRLKLDAARTCGLSNYTRIAFQVRRGGSTVNRVLALWRKL